MYEYVAFVDKHFVSLCWVFANSDLVVLRASYEPRMFGSLCVRKAAVDGRQHPAVILP